jgi:precorrin isomerase
MSKKPSTKKTEAIIHGLLRDPRSGADIEAWSFEIIDREAPAHRFPPDQWQVVRRMIHTAGDFGIMDSVRFSPGAIAAAVKALQAGRPIYVDSNMIRSGLSPERLKSACPGYSKEKVFCHIADPGVAEEALKTGLPRSLFAVRKARPILDGAIAVFGNAPVALLELNRMILEEGLRPALVIAVPVGFVHVVESKAELMGLDVPCIALEGRRGGSPLAVSVIHALCGIASDEAAEMETAGQAAAFDAEAIILLGHGSRVPGAGEGMEQVARRIREKIGHPMVETCSMQMLGPCFEDVFDRCAAQGARRIIVIPYFLHSGVHMREDIPGMLQEKARQYPGIAIILGKNLGYDESLADLVIRRIGESRELPEVSRHADHHGPKEPGEPS